MFSRVLAAIVVIVVAAALLVVAWPQLFGLQREPVIAQIVSFRGIALGIAALVLALLLIATAVSRRGRRFGGALALVVLLFGGVQLAVLATRGAGADPAPKVAGDITVLSWNTLGDAPGAARIARLAEQQHADVIVLAETSLSAAQAVQQQLQAAGMPMQLLHQSYSDSLKARNTELLISTRLGSYKDASGPHTTDTLPSVLALPVDGSGPTIIASHPVSPKPGEMAGWRQGLRWIADHCVGDAIAAGDFNSTLDHYDGLGADGGALGACFDAAKSAGGAAVGTWPTTLPPLLAAPIDHVMATSQWTATGFTVIQTEDGAGSDHRPVVAQLHRAGS
jgi:endonuclease/exonuclease/phosphatase (EEP) superfamily protein YafD